MISRQSFEDAKTILNYIPLPIYVTDLSVSSRFHFINDAFAEFLQYTKEDLLAHHRPLDLYETKSLRSIWTSKMLGGKPLRDESRFVRGNGETIEVLDLARSFRIPDLSSEKVAIGAIIDMTDACRDRSLVAAYETILNLEWINLGLHQLDRHGKIFWMNRCEQKWLNVDQNWIESRPGASQLMATDPMDGKRIEELIRKKLNGDFLTIQEHETYFVNPEQPLESRRDAQTIPVNIHDHLTFDDKKPRKERILTVVRDERIDGSIRDDLLQFGPKNPLLGRFRIKSFIKLRRQFVMRDNLQADDDRLVFVWGNDAFEEELREQHRLKEDQSLNGKMEVELYPEDEFGPLFLSADTRVLKLTDGEFDESIECHPTSALNADTPSTTLTQVLKAPYFVEGESTAAGVIGFYWDTRDTAAIESLRNLYQMWQLILERIPLPVFCKDSHLRFIYVNKAFCDANNKTLSEIIGATDRELFPLQFEKYEDDDKRILACDGATSWTESHPHADGSDRTVKVWKQSIELIDGTRGLVGVYCDLNGAEVNPDVWIDYKWKRLHVKRESISLAVEGQKLNFNHDHLRFLDAMLERPNQFVDYATIWSRMYSQDPRNLKKWRDAGKAQIDKLHHWKREISLFLKESEDSLSWKCEIPEGIGGGYCLKMELL